MASTATFRVINPLAPREAVDPNIAERAELLRSDTASMTPVNTGRLAASWRVNKDGLAAYGVSTDVEYARFVEYGTRYMHGAAMLGRAVARTTGGPG
jgi:hypothetical protein